MGTGFDIRIANKKSVLHPKLSNASDRGPPYRRDAYFTAVRDGIIPPQTNDADSLEFTSMSGRPHNTFNGVHTKHRAALPYKDHPLVDSQQNGSMDFSYYTTQRGGTEIPHRRAMSVEPTMPHAHTIDRTRRDLSRDRRKRNISGERNKRGASVDRTAAGAGDRKSVV